MRQASKCREEEEKRQGNGKEMEANGREQIRLRAVMLLALSAKDPAHQNL